MPQDGYAESWDSYWRDLPARELPIWETDPADAAERDVKLLEPWADLQATPIVDVGCGLGGQTRALGRVCGYAVGLDFSPTVVERARQGGDAPSCEFQQADLLNRRQMWELAGHLGTCNVYMRSVLHQMPPGDRPDALASIRGLLGDTGVLLSVELTPKVGELRRQLVQQEGGPPPRMARAERHGIVPGQWNWGELPGLLEQAGLHMLDSGETDMVSSQKQEGELDRYPMMYHVCSTHPPG